ncbi:hypothetical protein L1279_001829 [Planomicrobium sp. HSC-17F08]|nr:hypothetical protein [Planomicrobium sp. HSC-17F08]
MKINRPYFYLILFTGIFAVLVGFNYSKSGSFEWFGNFMQSAFITVFYIIFTDKSYKKSSDEKSSQP